MLEHVLIANFGVRLQFRLRYLNLVQIREILCKPPFAEFLIVYEMLLKNNESTSECLSYHKRIKA